MFVCTHLRSVAIQRRGKTYIVWNVLLDFGSFLLGFGGFDRVVLARIEVFGKVADSLYLRLNPDGPRVSVGFGVS